VTDLGKNRLFMWNKEGCRENKNKCRIYTRGMHHYCGTSVFTRQMNLGFSKNYIFLQTEKSMLVIPSLLCDSETMCEHISEQYAPVVFFYLCVR